MIEDERVSCVLAMGLVPALVRIPGAGESCLDRNCAADADGRSRRGVILPLCKRSLGNSSWIANALVKAEPDCDLLSVEELPLLFLSIYFPRASASCVLTRLAMGARADTGFKEASEPENVAMLLADAT